MHKDLEVALTAVRRAGRVCRTVQAQLVTPDTLVKKDRSPVTIADFAAQAIVCATVDAAHPQDAIVGEERADVLRTAEHASTREKIAQLVNPALNTSVDTEAVLSWIDRGTSDASTPRFWTVDPVDGTKGFLRGGQYAVALALIEGGQVQLAALACPNISQHDGLGEVVVAARGHGAQVYRLDDDTLEHRPVSVAPVTEAAQARFVESVESKHSDQTLSARIAETLGITHPPVRMDSQAKYSAVAQGAASIYLRLPTRTDYQEWIWDHAAGALVVEEAGGKVTDTRGHPLDFSQGRKLTNNVGIIATTPAMYPTVLAQVRAAIEAS